MKLMKITCWLDSGQEFSDTFIGEDNTSEFDQAYPLDDLNMMTEEEMIVDLVFFYMASPEYDDYFKDDADVTRVRLSKCTAKETLESYGA